MPRGLPRAPVVGDTQQWRRADRLNSGGNLLEREARDVGALAGVLDGQAQDAPGLIHVEQRVFVQVALFGHVAVFELDVQRVGVLKVLYSHNLTDRSKKALSTVS